MFGKSPKKGVPCNVCNTTSIVAGVISVLAVLASLVGVYKAHVLVEGLVFGTNMGSLSLIALVASLAFALKMKDSCCPCQCNIK